MLKILTAASLVIGLSVGGGLKANSLIAYVSPPGVMSSAISGAATETFNDPNLLTSQSTTYASVIGVYSVASGFVMPVIDADQYGGADGSQYMYVGQRRGGDATTVSLALPSPVNYFGFWWSAGDPLNRISVYSGGIFLASFQTDDITSLLSSPTVQAIDGSVYQSHDYYGNPNVGPNQGADAGEPFAYVSLVATGFSFDEVVFDNAGGSGFENDNNSVYAGALNIPRDYTDFVKVTDVPFNSVPEPSSFALISLGAIGMTWVRRRFRVCVNIRYLK